MRRSAWSVVACVGVACGVWWSAGSRLAGAQEVSPPERSYLTIPATQERTAPAPALVREIRNVRLVEGNNFVRVYDFSPRLDPRTLMLRSLTAPAHLDLVDQSLWFEILDRTRLLELLVGQEVALHLDRESTSEDFSGRLLLAPFAAGPKGEISVPTFVETPEGSIRPVGDAEIRLDNLPEGTWNRPRLDWRLVARNSGRDRVEMSYLTEGLSFSVHYLVRIADDGQRADLRCLASIANDTGIAFADAEVQLEAAPGVLRGHRNEDPQRRAAAHLYPVDHPLQLEARRGLQVLIASVTDAPVRSYAGLFVAEMSGPRGELPVRSCFDIDNSTERGLGLPLPPGSLEVRMVDPQGRMFAIRSIALDASVTGESLTFPAQPIPGVRALLHLDHTEGPRTVEIQLVSERTEMVEVTVIQPLDVRERVVTTAASVDLSRPGTARISVQVPSSSGLTLRYQVERDG